MRRLFVLSLLLVVGAATPEPAAANDASGPHAGDGGRGDGRSERRCRAFADENARTYKLLSGCPDCVTRLRATFDACHVDAHGAWGYVIDTASMNTWGSTTQAPVLTTLLVGWSLVRRDDVDGGQSAPSSVQPFMDAGEDVAEAGANWADIENSWDTIQIASPMYFDYDGDGVDEVILSAQRASEGGSPAAYELWTAKGGTVTSYPTGIVSRITGVEDVDHDGRPDFETVEVGADIVPGIGSPKFSGPTIVFHSLADGTFSGRDATARDVFEKQCPRELRTFTTAAGTPGGDDSELIFPIVCARAAGASADAIREVLARRRPAPDGAADSPFGTHDLSSAIDGTPSFHLEK